MSALIPYLVNGGVAGAVLVAFMFGFIYPKKVVDAQEATIHDLRAALEAERQRADAAVAAAAVTRDILLSLRGGSGAVEAAQVGPAAGAGSAGRQARRKKGTGRQRGRAAGDTRQHHQAAAENEERLDC